MPPLNDQAISHISARDLTPGALAGIVFGIFVGLMAIGCLGAYMVGRRR
jgi:hypothetical protein